MTPQWLDKEEYPFEPLFFDINGHRMHYVDEGIGETLLFVHGTPSWSFDFRNVIKNLRSEFRCIAADHMGFGLSDKPKTYDYATQNHSRTLKRFIEEKNLHDITLVVHDFGGPIGLGAALQMPERVKRLVILNSWLWSAEGEPGFERMKRILRSPLLPFLYRYLNFSARFILPAAFGSKKIDRKTHRQYTRPFGRVSEREGTLAFAKSLLNDQPWFEELWRARMPIANKPTLLIWGLKDPVIQPQYLEKFRSGFDHVSVKELTDSGHFPQEENPEETTAAIRHFLRKNI